jgi:methionyl-tRNA formyltransferase
MRVLFAGTSGIALPALRALAALEKEGLCRLAGALTKADSARGRHGGAEPTEVGAAAAELGLSVLKPGKLDAPVREAVLALKPDLLVSFAYGKIFGPKFLALFPLGGVNIHPSRLPLYRGAAPIQAAILAGDRETGICVQRLAAEMDAGDILEREGIPLSGRETAASLSAAAAEKGAELLARLIRRIGVSGQLPPGEAQRGEAVYCSPITREMGRIDWQEGAVEIDRKIRAFTPWPLCLTRHGEAELYILEGRPYGGSIPTEGKEPGSVLGTDKDWGILIQTGNGIFAAERLQYRTKKSLDWRSFLNGARDFTGTRLA